MTALIIYDSVFGNTEKVALAMAEALQNGARAVNVNQVPSLNLQDYDLILIGSPTRAFKPTEGLTFLKSYPCRAGIKKTGRLRYAHPPGFHSSKFSADR
jgi:flavodoxin